eukprot:g17781.t1
MIRQGSFVNGLLAHLLIVPAWVFQCLEGFGAFFFKSSTDCAQLITAPKTEGLLLGSLATACSPLGIIGILVALGLMAGLVSGPKKLRPALCLLVIGLAGSSKKAPAIAAALFASFLTWLVTRRGKIQPRPWLFKYVSTWAKDYYSSTALRGALDDIRPEKSFLGFHPHGCLCAGFTINATFNPDFIRACKRVFFLCDPALRHKNPGFRLMSEAYETEETELHPPLPNCPIDFFELQDKRTIQPLH